MQKSASARDRKTDHLYCDLYEIGQVNVVPFGRRDCGSGTLAFLPRIGQSDGAALGVGGEVDLLLQPAPDGEARRVVPAHGCQVAAAVKDTDAAGEAGQEAVDRMHGQVVNLVVVPDLCKRPVEDRVPGEDRAAARAQRPVAADGEHLAPVGRLFGADADGVDDVWVLDVVADPLLDRVAFVVGRAPPLAGAGELAALGDFLKQRAAWIADDVQREAVAAGAASAPVAGALPFARRNLLPAGVGEDDVQPVGGGVAADEQVQHADGILAAAEVDDQVGGCQGN